MKSLSRREFFMTASTAMLASAVAPEIAEGTAKGPKRSVFIGGHSKNGGIVAYDWDTASATLTRIEVVAKTPVVAWLAFSDGNQFMYSASEL